MYCIVFSMVAGVFEVYVWCRSVNAGELKGSFLGGLKSC